jgi:hypothetical protein
MLFLRCTGSAAKSAESTRQPEKSDNVVCAVGDFSRFLGRGQKFSLVGQSTTAAGPEYFETPWTVPLIAAHSWLKHDNSRVIRAYGHAVS